MLTMRLKRQGTYKNGAELFFCAFYNSLFGSVSPVGRDATARLVAVCCSAGRRADEQSAAAAVVFVWTDWEWKTADNENELLSTLLSTAMSSSVADIPAQ